MKILVGPEQRVLWATAGLIAAKSNYFKDACEKRLPNGQIRHVRLPNQDPKTVGIFLIWVHTSYIKNAASLNEISEVDSEKRRVWQLYLEENHQVLGVNSVGIARIWADTPRVSPLHHLVLRIYIDQVYWSVENHFLGASDKMVVAFLRELAFEAIKSHRDPNQQHGFINPLFKDKCTYHEHPDHPPGYSCTNKGFLCEYLAQYSDNSR